MDIRLLIVDDDPLNISYFREVLSVFPQLQIFSANSGSEAVQMAENESFQIVLMDVMMPGSDGFQTALEIQEIDRNKDAFIVFITAHDPEELFNKKGFDCGGMDYLTKPIAPKQLLQRINLYLRFLAREHRMVSKIQHAQEQKQLENLIRKKAEVELAKSRENFSNIVGKSEAAILIIDDQNILQFINPAGEEIFMRQSSEIVGEPLGIIGSEAEKTELTLIRKNGEVGYGEITVTKTVWKNKPANLVLINDITDYKKKHAELEQKKKKAEESDRLKSFFLANMSHEIRTPMNGIIGFTDIMLNQEMDKADRTRFLNIIHSCGNHLLSLINDIIDLSKIEAGKIEIKKAPFDLTKEMHELHSFFSNDHHIQEDNQVEIKLKTPSDNQAFYIISDAFRIRQVLLNLLGNANKFTKKGSIEFGYKIDKDQFLHFFVKDTGRGIPKNEVPKVFGRFIQANNQGQRTDGTGLGLAITKGLVELLEGKIWAESEEGKGSTFQFTIPYVPAEAPETQKEHAIESDFNIEKKRILVAEDNDNNYTLVESILKIRKADIIRAYTGKEVVELFESTKPELILLDISLPEMSGYEATRIIREHDKDTPIIAITAHTMENDKEKCLAVGCNDYLAKPITQEMLNKAIDHNLFQRYGIRSHESPA